MSASIETYLARLYLHTDAPRAAGDARRDAGACVSDRAAQTPSKRVAPARRSWLARLFRHRPG